MRRLLAPVVMLLSLGACTAPGAAPEPPSMPTPLPMENDPPPRRAQVEDLAAFERFVAGRPTPADFRARYPGVGLVLPGQIATKEFRSDRSRYFADLDGDGRITGGRFQ